MSMTRYVPPPHSALSLVTDPHPNRKALAPKHLLESKGPNVRAMCWNSSVKRLVAALGVDRPKGTARTLFFKLVRRLL